MKTGELLYEGKAKKIFATEDPSQVRVQYKDSATAFNGLKKTELMGKGECNNQISALLFSYLTERGIPNHFIKSISPTEQLVQNVTIIPIEVVVRNRAAGSLVKRLGMNEGDSLQTPIIEFYYKDDELADPMINEDHVRVLELATPEQVSEMKRLARNINEHLTELLLEKQVVLVDFKLEFGLDPSGQLVLADEISPDTCRFWDQTTGEKMDKDRFRRDLGEIIPAYQEILKRLGGDHRV